MRQSYRQRLCAVGALCLLSTFSPALAQSVSDQPELRNPTVVVTRTRDEQVRDYMADIMPRGTGIRSKGLPRWNSELCVSVIGPPVEQGQFIADRITQRAQQVGLEAGGPDCDTNLLIMVTDAPEVLLPEVVKQHRKMFGDPSDPGIDVSGTSAIKDLGDDQRPVRWRQVIETVSATGIPLSGDPRSGPSGAPENVPTVRSSTASRLTSNVRREVSRMIVVVDTRMTAGRPIGAIADYLAFVTLAQVDADADVETFPSIMGLFSGLDAPRSMTDWDVAYLIATYDSKADAVNAKSQLREMRKLIIEYDPEARRDGW
ncbi:hypothetical protein [Hyphomonas sp.]|uniref:hypothetical protein n=1 Tax=Hyphomonas sp. TaxID=87 RepID=UPI00391BEB1B